MQRALCVDLAVLLRPQRRKLLKLSLQMLRRARENEAERHAAVLAVHRMVQPVGLIEATQVPLLGLRPRLTR